jgi:hypothetical protein
MYLKATAAVLAATLAVAATAAPANAQRWGHRHHHHGSGIGAGIAGFAAGALIGGALASQPRYYAPGYAYGAPGYYGVPGYAYGGAAVDDSEVAYCQSRYRSYDPASGTYLGYDGQRHPCP